MIYLLRHGLDDEKYIGGYSDISLIPEGIKQVELARDFIVDNNLKIDKIYSSDIVRAKETTDIVNKSLELPVIYEEGLRELDKGLLTGLEKSKAYKKYPEFKDLKSISKKYPNGESMQEFHDRVIDFFSKFKDDNCLLITHRGVINMLYFDITNTPLSMDKEQFGVTHGSIHELDIDKKHIKKIF